MRHAAILVLAALATALGGCAGLLNWNPPPSHEVHNASAPSPRPEPTPERPVGANDYLVRAGDTVYSIAFRNNLDYRELARWNGVGPDYLIRPGQVLRLFNAPPQTVAVGEGDIQAHPADLETQRPVAQPIPLPIENLPVPPPSGVIPRRVARAPVLPPVAPLPPVVRVDPPPPLTSESGGAYQWQWPTQGVVVRGFNPSAGSKGLDFSGDLGQSVVAAAPGKVVYSGSALKGYGELVILKHDDLRLSAYGYNRKRLVEEGQVVRGGQTIAELGLGPENRPILHFEIRERGKPVNPAAYLPPR